MWRMGSEVVPRILDIKRRAIGQSLFNLLCDAKREGPIFFAVPQTNRHLHFFQWKSPWLRVNLCVDHDAFGRTAPGASLTFEAGLERS